MNARLMLFLAISLLVAVAPLFGQESVCALFSHLEGVDGQQVRVAGELIISKDLAVLGAADCDNQYIFREQVWPTALLLRPSPAVTPAQLQEFQNAVVEADSLRHAGKTVSASASFSGRIRLTESGDFPAELTFDSFENLKTEALPDVSALTVIPICDLFQHLPAWKGKRIAVRGKYVSTMEGAWIVGACNGTFVTDGYRWPVALTYGSPAYYSQTMAKLYDANWPAPSEGGPSRGTPFVNKTATFVGRLRMRSEYSVSCRPDGRYVGNGFGHLNGAAAELLVEGIDAFGETALMKASEYGYDQTIKVLIEHGAELNVRDNKGRTAVMHAADSCCSHAIPLLLENGADPNAHDKDGKTALDLADASNNLAAIAELSVATKTSH